MEAARDVKFLSGGIDSGRIIPSEESVVQDWAVNGFDPTFDGERMRNTEAEGEEGSQWSAPSG
jgi:hypothetical protein